MLKTQSHRIVILIICRMYTSTYLLTQHWLESLPIITKTWFGLALVLTLSGNLGFVSPMKLIFSLDEITSNFEVWRVLSCFCYAGGFSLPTLICLIMLVQFSNRYETSIPYNTGGGGGTADYAFALVFCMITMLITGPLVSTYFVYLPTLYTDNMVYFVVYVWSKRNPTSQASIWGVQIKSQILSLLSSCFQFGYRRLHCSKASRIGGGSLVLLPRRHCAFGLWKQCAKNSRNFHRLVGCW